MNSDYPEGQIQDMQKTIDDLRDKLKRTSEAWLREEDIWQALDRDRFRFQSALEKIAQIPHNEDDLDTSTWFEYADLVTIAREALANPTD